MSNFEKYYPRGFLFSDETLNMIPEYYKLKVILNKYYYYYDEDQQCDMLEIDNKFIVIHGEYLHIGTDNQFTRDELKRELLQCFFNDYNQYLETLDFIAGRYVIIIGDIDNINIYPDASNTRSTYYTTSQNVISSHVYLINDQFRYERMPYLGDLPNLMNGLNITPFKNIKSLIPNHYLEFYSKNIKRFFTRENNKYSFLTEDERFNLLERFFKKQFEYYIENYSNIIFSLTGGGDSRFLLAVLHDYLDHIESFTYSTMDGIDNSTYAGRLLTLDYQIVKQIVSDININHKFIYYKDNKLPLTPKEDALLTKNTIGRHSSFLIPHTKNNFNITNLKHIRGNLLETGKARYYSKQYKESNIEEVKPIYNDKYAKSKNKQAEKYAKEIFNKFIIDINYGENIYDYHLLDLYHWEIRMGRWHPEILNTHDIVFDTISPFNQRAIIDISLSFTYEQRRDEYMYK